MRPLIYHHVTELSFGAVTDVASAYIRNESLDHLGFRFASNILFEAVFRFEKARSRQFPVLFEFAVIDAGWAFSFRLADFRDDSQKQELEKQVNDRLFQSGIGFAFVDFKVDPAMQSLTLSVTTKEHAQSVDEILSQNTQRIEMGQLDFKKIMTPERTSVRGDSKGIEPVYSVNADESAKEEVTVVKGGLFSRIENLFSSKRKIPEQAAPQPLAQNFPEVSRNDLSKSRASHEKDLVILELREKLKETTRPLDQMRIRIRDMGIREQNLIAKIAHVESSLVSEKSEKNRLTGTVKELRDQLVKTSKLAESHSRDVAELKARLDHSVREESRLRQEAAKKTSGLNPTREQIEFQQRHVSELKRLNQKLLERISQLETRVQASSSDTESAKLRARLEESLKIVVQTRKENEYLKLRVEELIREADLLKGSKAS